MNRSVFRWTLWVMAMGLLPGCTLPTSLSFREEFHQTYPWSEKGTVRLENVNGRVVITTWDRPEVQVEAVKSATSEERLQETKIIVKSESGSVSIKTEHPKLKSSVWRWNNSQAAVDYALKVPAKAILESIATVNGSVEITGVQAGLKVSTVNGHIKAQQIIGNTQLTTVNGGVDAEVLQLDKEQVCRLETVNGHAHLSLPTAVNAEIEASTVNGGLQNNLGLDNTGKWPHRKLQAKLGDGGATIKVTTVNGGISIQRANSPQAAKLEVQ